MFHYVYRIIHVPTARFYIGVRSSNRKPERDNYYWGSGTRIQTLIKSRPRAEFKKTVLSAFSTREEASSEEERIVTIELLHDPLCLNRCLGGDVGFSKLLHHPDGKFLVKNIMRGGHRKRVRAERLKANPRLVEWIEYEKARKKINDARQLRSMTTPGQPPP